MPEQDDSTPTVGSSAPVAPPARIEMPPTSTQIVRDEGEQTQADWQRRFDSVRGELRTRQSQWDTWLGSTQTLEAQLRDELREVQEQYRAVSSERENYKAQVENLPQLQEQASQVPPLQQQLQRLETFLRYPKLLGQTTVETQTQTGEDGQETQVEVRSNPYLDMALSSTLQGDAFQSMLNQLEGRMQAPQPQTVVPQGTAMNVPSQPQPVVTTGLADLQQQYEEARNRGDGDESFRLIARMMELKQQSG